MNMYWSKDTELVFNVAREAKIVAHPWLTSLQVVILLEKSRNMPYLVIKLNFRSHDKSSSWYIKSLL